MPAVLRYWLASYGLVQKVKSSICTEFDAFENYMMATGEMATDVGTILYGKEAVSSGLIDRLGGLSDALAALHKMIEKQGTGKGRQ